MVAPASAPPSRVDDPPRNHEEPAGVGEEEAIDVIEIKDESEDEEGQAEDGEEEKEDEKVAAPGPGVLPISAPGGEDATPPPTCVTSVKTRLKAGKDAWKAVIHVTGARGGARVHQLGHWPTKEAADRAVANHRKPDRPGRSALKGVCYDDRSLKYRAILNKKQLGLYKTKKEAGLAYNAEARRLNAEVRRLGLPRKQLRKKLRKLNVFPDDVTADGGTHMPLSRQPRLSAPVTAGASAAGSGFVEDGSGAEGDLDDHAQRGGGSDLNVDDSAPDAVAPAAALERAAMMVTLAAPAAPTTKAGGHTGGGKKKRGISNHQENNLAKRHRAPGKSKAGDAGAMAEGATEATRMSTKAAATEEDKQREHEVRVAAPKMINMQTLLKQINDRNEAVAVREAEAQAARDAAAAEAQAARDAAAAAAAAAQYAATEKDKQGDAAAAAAATAMSLAAGGSGVAALAQAHAALEAHLVGVHPGLVNYIDVLVKLGVDTVNDLGKLDEEDIESLELKKWHRAEFMRACGK